ncbi:MAG TPA: PAS domain S-box protein [Bacteroidia bacterium]|jgi:PAS domain S-box-containing protein|nr:PAS domain S-box protein [Bacteroidia bacterium]
MKTTTIDKMNSSEDYSGGLKKKADTVITYFLISHYIIGLYLSTYYDTWLIGAGVGALSLTAYFSTKWVLPNSTLYQYVLSIVLGIFMAQYIYQMHGMFEMHFFAFIGSAILISYQNWKLQIPLVLFVVIHHASFAYLQYIGYDKIYFTQMDFMDMRTFVFHAMLAATVFFLCGFWSYHFKNFSLNLMNQSYQIGRLQEEDHHKELLLLERKVAESTILKSEKRYRQIVETAQEGIWMINENNVTVFVNKKLCEILGYSPEEMIGKTNLDFMDDETKKLAMASLERRRNGVKENFDLKFLTKSGKPVWTHLSTNPVTDDGIYKGALAMVTDITEKKLADEKIKYVERLLSEAQKMAKVGNWNLNVEKNELFCSDGLCDINGMKKGITPSFQDFNDMLHPDDRDRVLSEMMKLHDEQDYMESIYKIIKVDDKQTRIIRAIVRTEKNAEGKMTRMYGISQDITELKNAQNALEKTLVDLENRVEERTRDLYISREFFSKTLQSLGDGVISTDGTGHITFMNVVAEQLTGRTMDEVLGKPIELACSMVDEKTKLPIENPVRTCIRDNKIVFLPDNVIMFKKDGAFNYIDDSAAPILNDKNEIVGAVLIFRDITEKALYARKLQTAHQEIEEKNRNITDSILYAKHIQESTLPEINLLNTVYPESFVIFKPKDIVSGDFYWFAKQDNKFITVVADCTGHGVPGAFMSMIGCGFLNEIVHRNKITEPGEILRKLNKRIRRLLKTNTREIKAHDGMDIAICAIDQSSNKMQFAGANRSLIHLSDGNLNVTKGNKYGVGGIQVESTREYTSHEISYNQGDSIYMFTDGFGDQFGGENGRKMMTSNLLKMITSRHSLDMSEQEKVYHNYFEDWRGNQEQTDDVLMIGIKLAS